MSPDPERTATFETRHADPAAAATVAAALRPDNTPRIRTRADGSTVRTRIERDRTGGLQSSADDYLVNLAVADEVVADARGEGAESATPEDGDAADGGRDATGTNTNRPTDETADDSGTTDDTDTDTDTDTL